MGLAGSYRRLGCGGLGGGIPVAVVLLMRWEYRIEFPNTSVPETDMVARRFGNFGWLFTSNIIDQLDADGWELVTLARASSERPTLVFKRLRH